MVTTTVEPDTALFAQRDPDVVFDATQECCEQDIVDGVSWGPVFAIQCVDVQMLSKSCATIHPVLVGEMTRNCEFSLDVNGSWSKIDTSSCQNSRIAALALDSYAITSVSFLVDLLGELSNATSDGDLVQPMDVGSVVEILDNIVAFEGNLSTAVLQSIVMPMSNMMQLGAEKVNGTEIYKLPIALNKITMRVAAGLGNVFFQFVSPSVVISIGNGKATATSSWPVIPVTQSTAAEGCTTCYNDSATTLDDSPVDVLIPRLDTIVDSDAVEQPIQVIMYTGSIFFLGRDAQDQFELNKSLDSTIISIQVGNAEHFDRFSMYERITLRFLRGDQSLPPKCVSLSESNTSASWTPDGCYVDELRSTDTETVCSCDHLATFAVVSDGDLVSSAGVGVDRTAASESLVMYSGVIFSFACLVITIATFGRFSRDRPLDVDEKIVINICCTLIAAQVLYVATYVSSLDTMPCQLVTSSLQFCLLSMLCWITAEAVWNYNTFVKATEQQAQSPSPSNPPRITMYTLVCYGLPAVLAAALGMLGWTQDDNMCQQPAVTVSRPFTLAFITPLILVVVVCLFYCVCIVRHSNAVEWRAKTDLFMNRNQHSTKARKEALPRLKATVTMLSFVVIAFGCALTAMFASEPLWLYGFTFWIVCLAVYIVAFRCVKQYSVHNHKRFNRVDDKISSLYKIGGNDVAAEGVSHSLYKRFGFADDRDMLDFLASSTNDDAKGTVRHPQFGNQNTLIVNGAPYTVGDIAGFKPHCGGGDANKGNNNDFDKTNKDAVGIVEMGRLGTTWVGGAPFHLGGNFGQENVEVGSTMPLHQHVQTHQRSVRSPATVEETTSAVPTSSTVPSFKPNLPQITTPTRRRKFNKVQPAPVTIDAVTHQQTLVSSSNLSQSYTNASYTVDEDDYVTIINSLERHGKSTANPSQR